jgi:hypothetical protein
MRTRGFRDTGLIPSTSVAESHPLFQLLMRRLPDGYMGEKVADYLPWQDQYVMWYPDIGCH